MLRLPTTFKKPDTYHYAVLARKFVNPGTVGSALVLRTTLLVVVVEGVEVVMVDVIYMQDIGDEFQ